MSVWNSTNSTEREIAAKQLSQAEYLFEPKEFDTLVQEIFDWKRAEDQIGRSLTYADFLTPHLVRKEY